MVTALVSALVSSSLLLKSLLYFPQIKGKLHKVHPPYETVARWQIKYLLIYVISESPFKMVTALVSALVSPSLLLKSLL